VCVCVYIYIYIKFRLFVCCETWPYALKKEDGLSVFGSGLLRKIFGLKKGQVMRSFMICSNYILGW